MLISFIPLLEISKGSNSFFEAIMSRRLFFPLNLKGVFSSMQWDLFLHSSLECFKHTGAQFIVVLMTLFVVLGEDAGVMMRVYFHGSDQKDEPCYTL